MLARTQWRDSPRVYLTSRLVGDFLSATSVPAGAHPEMGYVNMDTSTIDWNALVEGGATPTFGFDQCHVLWSPGSAGQVTLSQTLVRLPSRAAWDPTFIWPSTGGEHPYGPSNDNVDGGRPWPALNDSEVIPPNLIAPYWEYEASAYIPADSIAHPRMSGEWSSAAYGPASSLPVYTALDWYVYLLPEGHPALAGSSGDSATCRWVKRSELLELESGGHLAAVTNYPQPGNVEIAETPQSYGGYSVVINPAAWPVVGPDGHLNVLSVPGACRQATNPFAGYAGFQAQYNGAADPQIRVEEQLGRHRWLYFAPDVPDIAASPLAVRAIYNPAKVT